MKQILPIRLRKRYKYRLWTDTNCHRAKMSGKIIAFIEENASHGKTKTKGKG
jgi:hypothetical protein